MITINHQGFLIEAGAGYAVQLDSFGGRSEERRGFSIYDFLPPSRLTGKLIPFEKAA